MLDGEGRSCYDRIGWWGGVEDGYAMRRRRQVEIWRPRGGGRSREVRIGREGEGRRLSCSGGWEGGGGQGRQ